MSLSNIFESLIPDVTGSWEARNSIKSNYREIRHQVGNESQFKLKFEQTQKLGDVLEVLHLWLITDIESVSYNVGGNEYQVTGDNHRYIQFKITIFMLLIWVKNALSFLFWIVVLILFGGLIALLGSQSIQILIDHLSNAAL